MNFDDRARKIVEEFKRDYEEAAGVSGWGGPPLERLQWEIRSALRKAFDKGAEEYRDIEVTPLAVSSPRR